jgi:hypothetical protein
MTITRMKPHVEALCVQLVTDDPTLTGLTIDFRGTDDDELKLILEAVKEN